MKYIQIGVKINLVLRLIIFSENFRNYFTTECKEVTHRTKQIKTVSLRRFNYLICIIANNLFVVNTTTTISSSSSAF